MVRPLTLGVMVVAVASSGTVRAGGPFDFFRKPFESRTVAFQAEPPLPQLESTPIRSSARSTQLEPVPENAPAAKASPAPLVLYPCVTYDDRDEMHPCAVPMIVSVPDPSSVKHPFYWLVGDGPRDACCTCGTCTSCCAKPMVNVEICVPPGCCLPQPRVCHNGRLYVYDFGEYRVDVKLHRGEIEVEYHD
jgi:hypothetical protein